MRSVSRVLIADDSAPLRRALVDRLRSMDGFEVVGEARDGDEAVRLASLRRPEILLLDVQMPTMNGLDALRAVRKEAPDVRVVMLTNHADSVYRRACLSAGAADFLDKTRDMDRLDVILQQVDPK